MSLGVQDHVSWIRPPKHQARSSVQATISVDSPFFRAQGTEKRFCFKRRRCQTLPSKLAVKNAKHCLQYYIILSSTTWTSQEHQNSQQVTDRHTMGSRATVQPRFYLTKELRVTHCKLRFVMRRAKIQSPKCQIQTFQIDRKTHKQIDTR